MTTAAQGNAQVAADTGIPIGPTPFDVEWIFFFGTGRGPVVHWTLLIVGCAANSCACACSEHKGYAVHAPPTTQLSGGIRSSHGGGKCTF